MGIEVRRLTEDELILRYPRLWHMAHHGGWPSIRDHGLMSVAALLDAYGVAAAERRLIQSVRRPALVRLSRPGLPDAVVRDQKPMSDRKLVLCLQDGLTPSQWFELLNSRVFFWLSPARVWSLLRARAYRDQPQTVLTLDTAGLVAAHRERIWLSPINSGSTLFVPQPRGLTTFQRIADFPFEAREATRSLADNVVELVVDHAVPDIAQHVLAVHCVQAGGIVSEIWRSPRATAEDHP
jgi:hypothetical protein